MVRASASGGVDLGLIPSRVKPMTLKSQLPCYERDSVKNKRASLLVVPLGKALSGIFPSRCGRWLAIPKRARICIDRFLVIGG